MARSSFDFNLGTSGARGGMRKSEEAPMRILVIGNFSGRAGAAAGEYAARRPLAIDIDNFDSVMKRLAPRVATSGGDEIAIGDLDDFHPDQLYRRLPTFERLRDLRERMQNPASFEAAAAAFRAHAQSAPPQSAPGTPQWVGNAAQGDPTSPSTADEPDADTVARLLGRGGEPAGRAPAQAGIDGFIRSIVAEHIAPEAPPHQAQYVKAVDEAIGAHMRDVLHAPELQALEATWRGVHWLVTGLELGETLKLDLLDATKAELVHDALVAGADLSASATYKTLVDSVSVAGAQPWSLVVAAFEFGPGGEDVTLLATLGAIAAHGGAALVASASPALAGCTALAETPDPSEWGAVDGSAHEAWQALRRSAMARFIALAAPRVLMRLPYGKSTDPIASFELDELGPARDHGAYLWGGGAFACALLVGRAFLARGWDMEPGDALDVDDLPAHTYDQDGEKHLQPCAEALLSERAGQTLLDRGLVPLLSYKNRNAIRVMRFQSIAEPPQALAGPWGS